MNKNELKKIEMKNDGKDRERFEAMARKVVNVPKKEIQELGKRSNKTAAKKSQER